MNYKQINQFIFFPYAALVLSLASLDLYAQDGMDIHGEITHDSCSIRWNSPRQEANLAITLPAMTLDAGEYAALFGEAANESCFSGKIASMYLESNRVTLPAATISKKNSSAKESDYYAVLLGQKGKRIFAGKIDPSLKIGKLNISQTEKDKSHTLYHISYN